MKKTKGRAKKEKEKVCVWEGDSIEKFVGIFCRKIKLQLQRGIHSKWKSQVSIYFYKEYIVVFGVDLILGINLRYIVIDFIIVNLFRVGSIILKENSLFQVFFFFFFDIMGW